MLDTARFGRGFRLPHRLFNTGSDAVINLASRKMNCDPTTTRNVWSDLMAAYLICSFNLVYFYIAQKSQPMKILSLSFPAVAFFVGIEYANWMQVGGSLIQWRTALIPIAACISYVGVVSCCVACAERRRLESRTAVGQLFDSENMDLVEELRLREDTTIWRGQALPNLVHVPIFTVEPDEGVIRPQGVVPLVDADATESPLTLPMTPRRTPSPSAPPPSPGSSPPDVRGV